MIMMKPCGISQVFALTTAITLFLSFTPYGVNGHGHLITPRSRNWYANQEGTSDPAGMAGVPPKENCPHCLNGNTGVCGKPNANTHNYDNYIDSLGNPMPWISQEVYTAGQEIVVKSYLDTHHNGHMIIKACPMGNDSVQSCFDTVGNELTFVKVCNL
jgi:hypothetical protein